MVSPSSGERAPRLLAALGIGLAVGTLACVLMAFGALEGAELRVYDALRARSASPPDDPPVVLVRIGEAEIGRHGYPISDTVLARGLARLAEAGPSAIGVDLYRDVRVGEGREQLAALAARTPALVFIEKFGEPGVRGVAPPDFARIPDQVGFSDFIVDGDGVLRRGLLMLWDEEGRPSFSLALQLALHHLARVGVGLGPDPDDPERMRLGETGIAPLESHDGGYAGADAAGYQTLLDFADGYDAFPMFAFQQALDGEIPADALRGRIAVVGTSAPSVKDEFQTPLPDAPVLGIAAHAHFASQLLRWAAGHSAPLRFWSDGAERLWVVACAVFAALAAALAPRPGLLVAALAAALALVVGAGVALFSAGVWAPLAAPALAALGSGGLVLADLTRRIRAERAAVMDLFGRYVSGSVAKQLWSQREAFMDGNRPRPQRLVITAMLTDLKGYTSAAEKMDPGELMEWINEYMDAMTQVIENHGGFVDDYTGDGIKANFGVPIRGETIADDARTAVRCSLAMGQALERCNADWEKRGLPTARMRIGLFTGEVVVGSLGSRARMKYTTVGDTVNTAARLESFRKEDFEAEAAEGRGAVYRLLVGGSTHEHLGEGFRTEFLGAHVLRGRGHPIAIHRVYAEGRRPESDEGSTG